MLFAGLQTTEENSTHEQSIHCERADGTRVLGSGPGIDGERLTCPGRYGSGPCRRSQSDGASARAKTGAGTGRSKGGACASRAGSRTQGARAGSAGSGAKALI